MVSCGTRTELCHSCNRYIKLKDQEEHFVSNCKYPLVVEKPKLNEIDNPYRAPLVMPKIDTKTFYNPSKLTIYDPTIHRRNNVEKNKTGISLRLKTLVNKF